VHEQVETPGNMRASVRFAKYRGLKSWRTSTWDPREELPPEYARVFAFENFRRAHKRCVLAL
jgi:pre-rRNA-processing protein TSR1